MNRKLRRKQDKLARKNNPAARTDLTAALLDALRQHQKGEVRKALHSYQKILSIKPDHPEALNFAGMAHFQLGDAGKASEYLRKAVEAKNDYVIAYNNLGTVLRALDHPAEAVEALRRAVELDANNVEALFGLGATLHQMNRAEQAIPYLDAALSLSPEDADIHMQKGLSLLSMGRIRDAEQTFHRVLSLRPDHPEAAFCLVITRPEGIGLDELETVTKGLSDIPEDDPRVVQASFALAAAYEKAGDADKAFGRYERGCALFRKTIDYDIGRDEAKFIEIEDAFSEAFIAGLSGQGATSERPIFIVGMPRSGTTLTEQILASHSRVHGGGELSNLGHIVNGLGQVLPGSPDFPESITRIGPQDFRKLGEAYVLSASQGMQDLPRFTDKMPGNFRYIGLIRIILPQAKIIHCQRNALDTCLSCYTKPFTRGQFFSYDLAELGRYYRAYARLMDHWRRVLGGAFLDIRYEDVVQDPRGQTERLLTFCDLPWEDACLEFHKTERQVMTASVAQVRQPIYSSSVRRWKRYEKHLSPLIEALGPLEETR